MKRMFLLLMIVLTFTNSKAQDHTFARTYTSSILPKGGIDLEFWHTSKIGHLNQYYHAQDQRLEVELGLGNNLQTAFYFNRYQKRFSTGSHGTETSNEIGFSNEWKWRICNPYVKKFGLALYGELGLKGGDELELEMKFIVDKIVGRHHLAFNAVFEYEKEFAWKNNRTSAEPWKTPIEFCMGYMYNLRSNLGLGFELLNHNGISKESGWEYSALFGGPTMTFSGDNFFVTFNYLPQWRNLHKTDVAPGNKVLDEKERTEVRILVGVSL